MGRYEQRIHQALDSLLQNPRQCASDSRELNDLRLVVLSDQHRGQGDGADDFKAAKAAYHAALAFYCEAGYDLFLLGDVEELWEGLPWRVLKQYEDTLALERRFAETGRYRRFFGNHDDLWSSPDAVRRVLGPYLSGSKEEVPEILESLQLTVTSDGEDLGKLLFVHGHQGTGMSDRFSVFSRLVVRFLWRPFQRLSRFRPSTPAGDYELRLRHGLAMYDWTRRNPGLLLIAGHTHQPVFSSVSHSELLGKELEGLRSQLAAASPGDAIGLRERLSLKAAELHWALAESGASPMVRSGEVKPSYFNCGCCCYADGEITGLEIAEGEIRLVRWPDKAGRPRRSILRRAGLAETLARCRR